MDLIYLFLFLLHITKQLPPNDPNFSLLPLNYQTSSSSFTITILPRTFPESYYFRHFHRTYNHTINPPSQEELDRLKKGPTVLNRKGQTVEEETEDWFPGLYPYIPTCNKDKKCTAIILWFTPEQLQKDNEKLFRYIYEKELSQSKAVSHLEEAIHENGDKLIIASIDERRALEEFYTNLAENQNNFLRIICPLRFAWGLIMIFFGRKLMKFIGFVIGFTWTAFLVNFWQYPARLSEFYSHQMEGDFYWNLALVLGSGLLAGLLASKSDKIALCVFYGLIGFLLGGYVLLVASILLLIGSGRAFYLFMFGMEAFILYRLTKFVLKYYQQASAVVTSLFGGISVGLSIFLFFSLRITGEGIGMGGLGTRNNTLLVYLSIFLTWYGTKHQMRKERENMRRRISVPQEKKVNKKAENKKGNGVDEGFRNRWRNYEANLGENQGNTAVGE